MLGVLGQGPQRLLPAVQSSGAPHQHFLPCHSFSHTNLKSPGVEQVVCDECGEGLRECPECHRGIQQKKRVHVVQMVSDDAVSALGAVVGAA